MSKHKKPDDLWITIHGDVFNVTAWSKKHPGGPKVLQHYGGEDATIANESFHNQKELVQRYMKVYKIGRIVEDESKVCNSRDS